MALGPQQLEHKGMGTNAWKSNQPFIIAPINPFVEFVLLIPTILNSTALKPLVPGLRGTLLREDTVKLSLRLVQLPPGYTELLTRMHQQINYKSYYMRGSN